MLSLGYAFSEVIFILLNELTTALRWGNCINHIQQNLDVDTECKLGFQALLQYTI